MHRLRLILRLLPEEARHAPLAWRAIEGARQHPDAYLWERDAPADDSLPRRPQSALVPVAEH